MRHAPRGFRSPLFASFAGVLCAAFLAVPPGMGPLGPSEAEAARKHRIKFATLAPEGSTWMNVMRDFARGVKQKTGGQVRFRIYAGGVQGDEKDVVRKMRIGQIHSAGFTGVGLGEILPETRVLELPFLFFREEESDFVHKRVGPRLSAAFEGKGFVLLGWAEVGLVRLFSKRAIRTQDDLTHAKVWAWEGDPLVKAYFQALRITPITLSITEVLTSLQTGLIDTVYASPLAAIALQWFTRVEYMTALPISNGTGAVLISKKTFDRLSPKQQTVLKEEAKRAFSPTGPSEPQGESGGRPRASKGRREAPPYASPQRTQAIYGDRPLHLGPAQREALSTRTVGRCPVRAEGLSAGPPPSGILRPGEQLS